MKWFDFLLFLASRKRLIIINMAITIPVAFLIAFSMQKYYKSEMSFLPPEQNSGMGLAGLLSGGGLSMSGMDILSSYYNLNTTQIKMILESKTIRTRLINQFNLIQSYKLKKSKRPYEDALTKLSKRITISEVERSGLGFSEVIGFKISLSDTSAQRAYEMLKFYFADVQSTVNNISTEKAKKVKAFTEELLVKNRADLAKAEGDLLAFQLKNKVLDLPLQMRESVKAYSDLKASLLMKTMELNLQKNDYQANSRANLMLNNEIESMKKEIETLENKRNADYQVGLNIAPELYFQFIELTKAVETCQKLDILLLQTSEYAKIQEIKTVSTIQVVDAPIVAEYKYKPKRIIIIAFIIISEAFFVVALLFIKFFHQTHLVKNDDFARLCAALKATHK